MNDLELEARAELDGSFGPGPEPSTASAPGRITLVGEHVDYVGGKTACMAINLHVAAATRPSSSGLWRVTSRRRVLERAGPAMNGDIGDRVFAACIAAGEATGNTEAVEIALAAGLPEGAGLSSSAAVVCATLMARLNQSSAGISTEGLVHLATRAEREIAGIPCGDMDQWAVIASREHHVLIFDAALGSVEFVPWPWCDLIMVVVDTGVSHDVGGEGYASRRAQATSVLQRLGVASCQAIGERWREITDEPLRRRARHIATETERVDEAILALRQGDGPALGALITGSHRSLDHDYEVSTPDANGVVAAAAAQEGCLGARLVGGGFGGSVMALCREASADRIRRAMAFAVGRAGIEGSWIVMPGKGALEEHS